MTCTQSILARLIVVLLVFLCIVPAAEAQPDEDFFTVTDVMIPISDSVDLHGRLYRPEPTGERRPTIFSLTPYTVDAYGRHAFGTYFAKRGYVYLNVDTRGRGASDGTFWPYLHDGPDGAAVARWIAEQPWSDGQVAMRGGSYMGAVQWRILAEGAGPIQTAIPTAAPYPGWPMPPRIVGSPRWLIRVQGRALNHSWNDDAEYWTRKFRELHRSGRPYEDLGEMAGISSRLFDRAIEHLYFDDYWQSQSPDSTDYRRLEMPILTVTGHFDFFNRHAVHYYREHQEYGSEQSAGQHYLLIGPWDHVGTLWPEKEVGGLTFADTAAIDMDRLNRQWFDWVLKDGSKPRMLTDRVVYYVMGTGQWRTAPSLEAVADTARHLYLHSPAKTPSDPFDAGRLAAQPPEAKDVDHYVYNPRDTADFATLEAMEGSYTAPGAAFLEGPKLIYHSDPVEESFEMSGQMRLDAWIELDVPDTDLAAWVYEVRPTGKTIYLGKTWLRARHRNGVDTVSLAEPGQIERYRFERFHWTAREIKEGSRIRLVIAPLNDPTLQKNYNSGGPPKKESVEDARTATVKLHLGPDSPSKLVLPVRSDSGF